MKYSLSTRITIIFSIGFTVTCILFFMFAKLQNDATLEKIKENQFSAINWLLSLYQKSNMPENWESYFKNFNLEYVTDTHTKDEILKNGTLLDKIHTPIGTVETIFYTGNYIGKLLNTGSLHIRIKNKSVDILLVSVVKNNKNSLIVAFLLTIAVYISLYISIFKSLAPLKQLRNDIRKFAAGNLDSISCDTMKPKGDDEVSEVAYEFNKAACKIKELILSRQLFLRTVMHELKTPIGKGRIVSEMIEDETQKDRLITVFERLNILINEFAKIEQLIGKSYSLQYGDYHFSLILEQAQDMLLLDDFETKVKVNIKQDTILRVDFQLFSLAIKNLIDNAIKYSDDKQVQVICDEKTICIKNKGRPLNKPIEYYKQAFVRDNSAKVGGIGLGLYIIEHICSMHQFQLTYDYCENYHVFTIWLKK